MQRTYVESEAYELIFGTGNFLRPRSDWRMLLVVNGGGDFIKYDLANYRNDNFGASGSNTNNMWLTTHG